MTILLALALQAATSGGQTPAPAPAAPPAPAAAKVETRADGSQRWSILVCQPGAKVDEIVVCANKDPLPFDGPVAGQGPNHAMSAANALALQSTPCAARIGGCQVGVNVLGPPVMLVRAIQKLVNPDSDCCAAGEATDPMALARDAVAGIKRATARKPDKRNRVAIPLDDPPAAAPATPATATP